MQDSNYEKENWVALYHSALLGLEHAKMAGQIADARESIASRVQKLLALPGLHTAERQAIVDALNNLRILEQEESRYSTEQKRRAAARALEALKTLAPAIETASNEG